MHLADMVLTHTNLAQTLAQPARLFASKDELFDFFTFHCDYTKEAATTLSHSHCLDINVSSLLLLDPKLFFFGRATS